MVEVDGDGYAPHLTETPEVYHADGVLVVGHHVAARVGHVDLAVGNLQLVGLEAHQACVDNLECGGVNLGYEAALLIVGPDDHGAGVGRDVGVAFMESYVAAVGDVHLADAAGCGGVHHLHLVGAVDHCPEAAAVDGYVVAHVTHLLGHRGVGLAVDVAGVDARGVVVVVEGGFVGAHVALVEEVESMDAGVLGDVHADLVGHEYLVVVTAAAQQCARQHKEDAI